MQTLYFDSRPRAPIAVFRHEVLPSGSIRLTNTSSGRTSLVDRNDFNRNYEPIRW